MAGSVAIRSSRLSLVILALLMPFSQSANVRRAIALMRGAGTYARDSIRGTVVLTQEIQTLEEEEPPVVVTVSIEGLSPGEHGFHIHEYGDARTTTTETLGKHFTPVCVPSMCETETEVSPCSESCPVACDMTCQYDSVHGFPPSIKRQAGDMGNITADSSGRVEATLILGQGKMSLADAKRSVVGRSIVIHERPDDGSQPFGNAGSAMAFGIIGIAAVPGDDTNVAIAPSAYPLEQAICVFQPVATGTLGLGMALLTFVPDYIAGKSQLKLQALISGLPVGKHSFHFHEFGDLSVGVEAGVLGTVYSDSTIQIEHLEVKTADSSTRYEHYAAAPSHESVARHVGRMLTIHNGPDLSDPTVATAVCGIAKFRASIPGLDDLVNASALEPDAGGMVKDTNVIVVPLAVLVLISVASCVLGCFCSQFSQKVGSCVCWRRSFTCKQERGQASARLRVVVSAEQNSTEAQQDKADSAAVSPKRLNKEINMAAESYEDQGPTLV